MRENLERTMTIETNRQNPHNARFLAPLILGLSLVFAPALASGNSDVAALSARLASDQAKANALEQQLGATQNRELQVADLFGPSDEEKAAAAAAAQHEQTQDNNIATLNQRAGDLEDSLRRLTGQIEELNHRLDDFDQRLDRVKKDFDYKLCTLSAQQLGASAAPGGDANAVPCNGNAASIAPPAEAAPAPGVTHLAPGPGVLGTLPANAAVPPPPPSQSPAPNQLASIDTRSQFDSAMNLLAKAQYDEARGAFRSFADAYPKDPLAPQALYWVGDIAYVQKDFATASRTFAEELKKFPASPRAPESMLKLGQSLIAMNQKPEGCMALRALASKYPTASKTVTSEADAVRKAGGCKH
jgi:tol-pal system protein YbgF